MSVLVSVTVPLCIHCCSRTVRVAQTQTPPITVLTEHTHRINTHSHTIHTMPLYLSLPPCLCDHSVNAHSQTVTQTQTAECAHTHDERTHILKVALHTLCDCLTQCVNVWLSLPLCHCVHTVSQSQTRTQTQTQTPSSLCDCATLALPPSLCPCADRVHTHTISTRTVLHNTHCV